MGHYLKVEETSRERPSDEIESSQDRLLGEEFSDSPLRRHRRQWLLLVLSAANIILFCSSLILWYKIAPEIAHSNGAYQATSAYSPIFEKDVNFHLDMPLKNDTLWGSDETTSIYIQDPSPEVDAAWDHIAAAGGPIITISREEAIRLGRDPDVIVKAPEDWGFGNDAYPAQIDVFHEIHCLNMLRKEMVKSLVLAQAIGSQLQYWDHYFRRQYGDPKDAHYLHVRHKRHCLRIVLRSLMCNADVDIVTHYWHHGSFRPIADFNNPRQCRNFAGLLEWNNAHAVPDDEEKWRTIKRPSDAALLPRPTPNLYISEDLADWIKGS